ncbi:hypothetical protein VTN77DRAFT_3607 [Rasamsonia byssochlamydoides]|uniref:uncharacterized protein n=1 Tax=Rasamsonia byssochlamydoides TaxID=89139 RepID=UPI003741F6B7
MNDSEFAYGVRMPISIIDHPRVKPWGSGGPPRGPDRAGKWRSRTTPSARRDDAHPVAYWRELIASPEGRGHSATTLDRNRELCGERYPSIAPDFVFLSPGRKFSQHLASPPDHYYITSRFTSSTRSCPCAAHGSPREMTHEPAFKWIPDLISATPR